MSKRFTVITDDNGDQVLYQNSALGGATANDGSQAGKITISDVGPITPSRNRNLEAVSSLDPVAAAADVNEAFWPASVNVRQLITEITEVSGTLLYIKAVFNVVPDSDIASQRAIAKSMLAVSNSSDTDVQWEKLILGKDFIRRFGGNTSLRNCFFQAVGTTPIVSIHLGGH